MTQPNIDRADPPLIRLWHDSKTSRRHLTLSTRDPDHSWCGISVDTLTEDDDSEAPRPAQTLCIECMANGPTFDALVGRAGGLPVVTVAEVGLRDMQIREFPSVVELAEGMPLRLAVARRLGLVDTPFAFRIAVLGGLALASS